MNCKTVEIEVTLWISEQNKKMPEMNGVGKFDDI